VARVKVRGRCGSALGATIAGGDSNSDVGSVAYLSAASESVVGGSEREQRAVEPTEEEE